MYTVHLDTSGMIHEFRFIAEIVSRQLTILYECFTFGKGGKMKTSCRMFNFSEVKLSNEIAQARRLVSPEAPG
jgi:hypothetical protein